MKLKLLLVALATLSINTSLCDESVSELERFTDEASQQQDTHENKALQKSLSDLDEEEVAQALNIFEDLVNKQDFPDTQEFDDNDLQNLNSADAELQLDDDEDAQAVLNAIAEIEDDDSFDELANTEQIGDDDLLREVMAELQTDGDGFEEAAGTEQLEDDDLLREAMARLQADDDQDAKALLNAVAEVQQDDSEYGNQVVEVEQLDTNALQALISALSAEVQDDEDFQDTHKQDGDADNMNSLATIQQENGNKATNLFTGIDSNEAMKALINALAARQDVDAETQEDDDGIEVLSELLASEQAGALHRSKSEAIAKALENSKSTAAIQWRRRRRWRRWSPRRVFKRVIRNARRIARRVRKVFRKFRPKAIIRKVSRFVKKKILKKPVRWVKKVLGKAKKLFKKVKGTPLLKKIITKAKKIFKKLKSPGSLLNKILKKPSAFLKKLLGKAGKLIGKFKSPLNKIGSKALNWLNKLFRGSSKSGRGGGGGGSSTTGGGGSSNGGNTGGEGSSGNTGGGGSTIRGGGNKYSWLKPLIDNPNGFLKELVVIIKKYGHKKKG